MDATTYLGSTYLPRSVYEGESIERVFPAISRSRSIIYRHSLHSISSLCVFEKRVHAILIALENFFLFLAIFLLLVICIVPIEIYRFVWPRSAVPRVL